MMTLYLKYNTSRNNVWHIWNEDFETKRLIHFEALCSAPNIADLWLMTHSKQTVADDGRLCLKCTKIKEFQEKERILDGISF